MKHTYKPNPYIYIIFNYQIHKKKYKKTFTTPISLNNIQKQSKQLYKQYRKKTNLYNYDTILIPLNNNFKYNSTQK